MVGRRRCHLQPAVGPPTFATWAIFTVKDAIIHFYDVASVIYAFIFYDSVSKTKQWKEIVIKILSPIFLDQETAKGPFGLRIKLPPAYILSHTVEASPCPFYD